MPSPKKYPQSWFLQQTDRLTLLERISAIFTHAQPFETAFQHVADLLAEYLRVVAGIYKANRSGETFFLKAAQDDQDLFKQQTEWTLQDLEICGINPAEFGMIRLSECPWQQLPADSFLRTCYGQECDSILHIPLLTQTTLYGLILLISSVPRRLTRNDEMVFSVLANHLSLAIERVLLTNHFEQEVSAKVALLHESEEKYRAVFEDASEAIVVVDIDTQRFLEVNRQATLLSGYSRDELLTMTVSDFWVTGSPAHDGPSQDERSVRKNSGERGLSESLLRLAVRRHSVTLRERQIRRKDGQRVWVALTASAVSYHGQEVLLAIIHNISQRKRLELERNVIESINQALISSHDMRNVYNTVAHNLRKVFAFDWMDILLPGSTANTLRLFMSININQNVSNLEEREYRHKDTRIQHIFQHNTPEIMVYQGREDSPIPKLLGQHLRASLFFPLEYHGHVIGILHFGSYQSHSFSAQHFEFLKRIASQLAIAIENTQLFRKISEERAVYKHLIENVNEVVFQVDPRGKIIFTNHRVQHVLGRTPAETIGTNFFSYVLPEDLESARAAFRLVLRHEQPFSGEYRVLHKSGKILTISIYTRPIFEDGRAVGMQGIIQNITPPSSQLAPQRSGLHDLIGRSPRMQEIYDLITSVAETDSTVLIHGESGTGKELIAHAIHVYSHRKHHPFIVVNCSAYSENLLESELFGHERGAFTGAHRRKLGRFELAKGGTIFLDEIGEIPLHSQLLLLRVLQNKTFERVGGEKTLETDVRIVAATNRNLIEEMNAGRFREDLYYRINVISIEVPPLCDRKEDIPALVNHFLKKYSAATGKHVLQCSQSTLDLLMEHEWSGNVRELENAIERAVVMASGPVITPGNLPASVRHTDSRRAENTESVQKFSLYEHEKRLIVRALKTVKWNKYQAAKLLGITRTTLYSKMKKYNLTHKKHTK